jgi:glycosyltransferase involved in cell wall biosynthesis
VTRVDVLIPTCGRPYGLAVTLACLVGQTHRDLRVIVSDQTEGDDPLTRPEVVAVVRVLRLRGHDVELHRHLPRRGLGEHRQFLLHRCTAPYCLFLDDDVILEPDVIERLHATIAAEACGLVASGLIGPSFESDVRPDQQAFEPWAGRVAPELVEPGSPAWERHRLHSAANLLHVQRALDIPAGTSLRYRLAWAGGCVLYDAAKLRSVGGFSFWPELPSVHCGEDVLAELRVMAAYGGCGIMPSGAFHQELPTTIPDRDADAPRLLPVRDG